MATKPTEETKALATVDEVQKYAIMQFEGNELAEVLTENLGGRKLGPNDLDRITVPPGGVTVWTVPTLKGEAHTETLEGLIVHKRTQRAYWPNPLANEKVPPDCYSDDGEVGSKYGACDTCRFNVFGTAADGTKRGKACKEMLALFMLRSDHVLPFVVSLPPTSIGPLVQTLVRLTSQGRSYWQCYWKLSLEKVNNDDGIKYSVVVPEVVDERMPPDVVQRLRSYRQGIVPMLSQVRVQADALNPPAVSVAAVAPINGTATTGADAAESIPMDVSNTEEI